MPGQHAILSPSSAKRWLACTRSARIEAEFPDSSSQAAEEGTLAHKLAEFMIREKLCTIEASYLKACYTEIKSHKLYSQEMWDYIDEYSDRIIEKYNAAKKLDPLAKILLEQKLDLTTYIPEGFGTGDVVIIYANVLEIDDLKFGKGVAVSAEENEQLMAYGLGALDAWDMLYPIDKVVMTIHQPRLDSVTEYTLSADALRKWGNDILKPGAELAFSGQGEFAPGDHCKFCRAKSVCKANKEEQLKILHEEFREDVVSANEKTYLLARPEFLTPEELVDIYKRAAAFESWLKGVKEFMQDEALGGTKWPDLKLVEGRSNRQISDPEKAAELLLEQGFEEEKIYTPKELLGITALEKNIGKATFKTLLYDMLVKPPGKPTLVPADDPRPELNSFEKALEDFPDDL